MKTHMFAILALLMFVSIAAAASDKSAQISAQCRAQCCQQYSGTYNNGVCSGASSQASYNSCVPSCEQTASTLVGCCGGSAILLVLPALVILRSQ